MFRANASVRHRRRPVTLEQNRKRYRRLPPRTPWAIRSFEDPLQPLKEGCTSGCCGSAASLAGWIVGPTLNVAHAQASAPALGDCDCNAAGVFLCSVRITAIFEKGEPSLNRIEPELHKLVRDDL